MKIETSKYTFYLDSTDEELGTLHAKMIEDFKDDKKLEYFKQLLEANPNTAFSIYNNI